MRVITGEVVDGRIEIPPDLAEGTNVAILDPDAEGFRLTAEQESELSAALAEIKSGRFEDGDKLLAELRGQHPS